MTLTNATSTWHEDGKESKPASQSGEAVTIPPDEHQNPPTLAGDNPQPQPEPGNTETKNEPGKTETENEAGKIETKNEPPKEALPPKVVKPVILSEKPPHTKPADTTTEPKVLPQPKPEDQKPPVYSQEKIACLAQKTNGEAGHKGKFHGSGHHKSPNSKQQYKDSKDCKEF